MIIEREIDKFILSADKSVADALEALNANKHQIVFVVDGQRHLLGCFTDGDFRRWVLRQSPIDIQQSVSVAMNTRCVSYFEEQGMDVLESRLNEHTRYVPVLDSQARICGIARRQSPVVAIDTFTVSRAGKTLVIAEIGNNHNGSLSNAYALVDAAIDAGADCVKFQMRDMASLYINSGDADDASEDLGSQYVLSLLKKYQLSDAEFAKLFDYCKQKKITVLCTPFDTVSADKLNALAVPAFKVASADLTNHPLLMHLCAMGKPLIVSTGMATEEEIGAAVSLLNGQGASYVLLHCNSTYPAPFKDINLRYLEKLSELNQGLIGYSGHERDIHVAVAAVALGAKVVEKHFTLDRTLEGNDHKVSLLPAEFKAMVKGIRQVEEALGNADKRSLSQGEMMNREVLAKSVYTVHAISKGTLITPEMVTVKSPGKGLSPDKMPLLIGTVAKRNMAAGEAFFPSDLAKDVASRKAVFTLPGSFGIPVRYHDVALADESQFDMLEFHLSFKDLALSPQSYLSTTENKRAVVHAPELFEADHTLDLASKSDQYRATSVSWLNQVLDVAREIKQFYPATKNIPVVVNAGGFSQNNFVDNDEKTAMYARVAKSISQLNLVDIDLLIQSMPPFPWHFGGQRYHNLFVKPDEIAAFCDRYDVNVCLDVSHSWLATNYFDLNIESFFSSIGHRIKHLHIADARGVDDEGLQFGEGDLPIKRVFSLYQNYCPTATWLPEIWQGHKNRGEGFWNAFAKLESVLETT